VIEAGRLAGVLQGVVPQGSQISAVLRQVRIRNPGPVAHLVGGATQGSLPTVDTLGSGQEQVGSVPAPDRRGALEQLAGTLVQCGEQLAKAGVDIGVGGSCCIVVGAARDAEF